MPISACRTYHITSLICHIIIDGRLAAPLQLSKWRRVVNVCCLSPSRERLEDHIFCASAPAGRVVRRRLADFCIGRTRSDAPEDRFGEKSCPAAFGCSGYGAALYELTTQTSGTSEEPQLGEGSEAGVESESGLAITILMA